MNASEFDRRAAAQEVASIRSSYVDGVVTRWLNKREGEASNEEILARENAAYRWWIDTYPTLNNLLGAHLPEHLEVVP